MKRGFQGVWIPREIWLSEELSIMEKVFFAEIVSFNETDTGCIASNQYFSTFFHISKARASQIVNQLKEKGLVELVFKREGKLIVERKIEVVRILGEGGKFTKRTSIENAEDINTSINKDNSIVVFKEKATKVIEHLNKKTGKKYRPVDTNLNLIINLMKKGYKYGDFIHVIDVKYSEWHNDGTMRKYLRPETLFRASHFDGYAQQDNSQVAPKREIANFQTNL